MTTPQIDIASLPPNAAIDTGVFIRGLLGDRPDEPQSGPCVAFCSAMVTTNRPLFVAAPTLTEAIRFRGGRIPHVAGVIVVPFDARAAEILGEEMPMPEFRALSHASCR